MILLVDNYDSFTYNLVQMLAAYDQVRVVRNDEVGVDELAAMRPARLMISPGPGAPDSAGVSLDALRYFSGRIPVLGVCLGHQALGQAFGGKVVRAGRLMHGKTSPIRHTGSGLFAGMPQPFAATRYHSLLVERASLPTPFEVTAWTDDENEIMGLRHTPTGALGVQFHPESILTESGARLLENFAMLNGYLKRVMRRADLTEDEMATAIGGIMDGAASPVEIAAFLVALKMKGETTEEISGAARAMRQRMTRVPIVRRPLVDTCGTGGDGAGTFNISTAVAFVVAACGVAVAKHGNRAVSSRSGSADVLAALGVDIEAPLAKIQACVEEIGLGFLFAPALHPAMKHAGPVRKELGVRTVFNLLGPLTNPAGAPRQLLGVYDRALVEPIAAVLGKLGSERAFVVHGDDGLDELTVTGPSTVAEWTGSGVEVRRLEPESVGLERHAAEGLKGGSPEENAAILKELVGGKRRGAIEDAVLLNAGAALLVAGKAADLRGGVEMARQAITQGAAAQILNRLVERTKKT